MGFNTKDLSLSFLGGNAALKDVEVNIDAVNEMLNQQPGVRLARLLVVTPRRSPAEIISHCDGRSCVAWVLGPHTLHTHPRVQAVA